MGNYFLQYGFQVVCVCSFNQKVLIILKNYQLNQKVVNMLNKEKHTTTVVTSGVQTWLRMLISSARLFSPAYAFFVPSAGVIVFVRWDVCWR